MPTGKGRRACWRRRFGLRVPIKPRGSPPPRLQPRVPGVGRPRPLPPAVPPAGVPWLCVADAKAPCGSAPPPEEGGPDTPRSGPPAPGGCRAGRTLGCVAAGPGVAPTTASHGVGRPPRAEPAGPGSSSAARAGRAAVAAAPLAGAPGKEAPKWAGLTLTPRGLPGRLCSHNCPVAKGAFGGSLSVPSGTPVR